MFAFSQPTITFHSHNFFKEVLFAFSFTSKVERHTSKTHNFSQAQQNRGSSTWFDFYDFDDETTTSVMFVKLDP